ncbi:MAG: virulence RhuM family protein, partial [Gallionella sp.]|nr:virulence RhuM family protein [Gallionella sp.]
MNQSTGQIAIYQTDDGQTQIDVRMEKDTLWLSQAQMSEVFDKDSDTIGLHLRNIYESGELDEGATTEDSSVVRQEGKRQVRRSIRFYNLDAIISVGYRVNSIKGTQFRIWATQRLREYLVQGYTLNQQRLEAQQEKMAELKQAIALSARLIHNKSLSPDESRGILAILEKYSHALTVLDDYDHQRLRVTGTRTLAHEKIAYDEAMGQIRLWRAKENLGGLFGNE